jgi:hypothetical protein
MGYCPCVCKYHFFHIDVTQLQINFKRSMVKFNRIILYSNYELFSLTLFHFCFKHNKLKQFSSCGEMAAQQLKIQMWGHSSKCVRD